MVVYVLHEYGWIFASSFLGNLGWYSISSHHRKVLQKLSQNKNISIIDKIDGIVISMDTDNEKKKKDFYLIIIVSMKTNKNLHIFLCY